MTRRATGYRLLRYAGFGLALLLALPRAVSAEAEDRDYLPTLRLLFYQATIHEPAVQEALSYLKARFPASEESWPAVAQAYLGALEGLQGKYARGLLDKLRHVQRAIGLLRDLPRQAARDPEVLFLRFSLFHQLPPFFGVGSTVDPDLERLIELLELRAYDEVPRDIQRSMAVYLATSGLPDHDQAERLRRLLQDRQS